MHERERFAAGEQVRRSVLGDAQVDLSLAKRNAFTEPLQDLILEVDS
jgi:4-carboxymuconolactone decarboxylase